MTDQPISRRTALTSLAAGAGALGFAGAASARTSDDHKGGFLTADELGYDAETNRYVLPPLPYDYDALEPAIDEQTMRIHHDKHHAGYIRGLNKALDELDKIRKGTGDAGLIKHWSRELAFHGSGHANHSLFWMTMAPRDKETKPSRALSRAIRRSFGSMDAMKTHMLAASKAVEASGWGWLALEHASGHLQILQGEKQQNMLTTGVTPILGVDVWEHAYYLKYQNMRGDYLNNWWTVIDWESVSTLYERLA